MNRSLHSLRAMFVEFTPRPGVLRQLQPTDDVDRAQGLHFNCPECMKEKDKGHGVTLLFDMPSVPKEAAPPGRYRPEFFPCKLDKLTLGEVKSPYCGWSGSVIDGEVLWT